MNLQFITAATILSGLLVQSIVTQTPQQCVLKKMGRVHNSSITYCSYINNATHYRKNTAVRNLRSTLAAMTTIVTKSCVQCDVRTQAQKRAEHNSVLCVMSGGRRNSWTSDCTVSYKLRPKKQLSIGLYCELSAETEKTTEHRIVLRVMSWGRRNNWASDSTWVMSWGR